MTDPPPHTARWRRIHELCHELLDLEPEEQRRRLEARDLEPDLAREVAAMLASLEAEVDDATEGDLGRRLLEVPAPVREGDRIVRIGDAVVTRKVGEGGMGVVYEGHDPAWSEPHAIKVIRPGLDSEQTLRRFQRECRVLEQLDHPGLAAFYGAGHGEVESADGRCRDLWYLSMELVRGQRLDRYADAHELDTEQRVELVAQVCDALQHAHERGVIHRDLKPPNILVEEPRGDEAVGRPKVLDFGIAGQLGGDTQTISLTGHGEVLGTARYMSPEQVVGGAKGLDARSDVYSLALVLFELLTGELPYRLDSQALPEIARVIVEDEPSRLGTRDTRFRGSPLEIVLSTALEKNRARRYPSMAAFAADLRRVLSGRTIAARRPPWTVRSARFARRHKVVVGTMAALSLGLVSSVVLGLRADAARERADRIAYRANLAAAAAALDVFDFGGARSFLDETTAARRGWEHRHLAARLEHGGQTLPGYGFPSGLAFTDDGRALRIVWPREPSGATWRLTTVALDDDADPARAPDAAEPWRAFTRTPHVRAEPLEPGALALRIGFDDGPWGWPTASAASAPPVLYDAAGEVWVGDERAANVGPLENPYETVTAVGADAAWMLVAQRNEFWWWPLSDDADGPADLRPQLRNQPVRLAISRDGRRLATAGEDGELCLWTTHAERPPELTRRLLDHRAPIWAVTFSPSGDLLFSGGADQVLRAWDTETGELLQRFVGQASTISAIAYDEPRGTIASHGLEDMRVWRFAGRDPRRQAGPSPLRVSADPAARLLFGGHMNGELRAYDVDSLALVARWQPDWDDAVQPFRNVAVGRSLLAVGVVGQAGGVRVIDLASGAPLPPPQGADVGPEWRVALAPDETRLFGCSPTEGLRAWDPTSGRLLASVPGESARAFVAVDPTGALLATPGDDGAIVLRRGDDLAEVRRLVGHEGVVMTPTFSADGRRLASPGRDDTARVWDVRSGRQLAVFATPGQAATSVAFAPDGSRLATGAGDGSLRIWSLAESKPLLVLRGHEEFVSALWFTPDGGTLFSSGADGALQAWDTDPASVRITERLEHRRIAADVATFVEQCLTSVPPEQRAAHIAAQTAWTPREREVAAQRVLGRVLEAAASR